MQSGRRVRFTQLARIDLRSIEEYSEAVWGHDQRIRYMGALRQAILRLGSYPYLGRTRTDILPDVRSISNQDHVTYYGVLPDEIRILRILHSRAEIDPSQLMET